LERKLQHRSSGDWAHRAQHDELTQKVLQLQRDLESGKLLLTIEAMQFLSNWLRMHIGGSDRKYAPFVIARLWPRSSTA
jgi:hemerythrin